MGVVVWLSLVVVLAGVGLGVISSKPQAYTSTKMPNTESGQAWQIFKDTGASLPDNTILVSNHPTLKVTDLSFRTVVEDAAAHLKTVNYSENSKVQPAFVALRDYLFQPEPDPYLA